MSVGHSVLLGIAVVALAGAGLRLASLSAERGLERVLAAVTYACAAAVIEAMALGIVDLGTSPASLTVAAVATWLLTVWLLPAPAVRPGEELVAWLESAPRVARIAVGAVLGLGLIWLVWVLRHPRLGIDTIYYHLPQSFTWVQNGTPGSTDQVNYLYEVQSYPLVHQILVAWSSGISRSLAPASVLPFAGVGLFITAAWVGLRNATVPVLPRILAVGAVITLPLSLNQLLGPLNDLPALTWVVVATALLLAAQPENRHGLVAPALIAAALAAGTKTTALVPALIVLAAGAYAYRGWLRDLAPAIGIAAAVAVGVGAFWYLRTTVDHGSPFWPWADTPWGDSTPGFLERTYTGFIDKPGATLAGRLDEYATFVGAAPLLLVAAMALTVLARRQVPLILAGMALLLFALWAVAPSTAITDEPAFDGSISATRYALPAFCAAAAALALLARERWVWGTVATVTLGACVAINLIEIARGDAVEIARGDAVFGPRVAVLVLGLMLGGCLAALVRTLPTRLAKATVVGPIAVLLIASLAVPAGTYSEKYVATGDQFDSPLVDFFSSQHGPDAGDPISMAPFMAGTLAGNDLGREVELIPKDESCPEVADRLNRGWVVILGYPLLASEVGYTVGPCLKDRQPVTVINGWRVYAPIS